MPVVRLAERRLSAHFDAVVMPLVFHACAESAMRPTIAADLLWAITSLRTWEDLVLVRGWTAAQDQERLVSTLLRVLTNTPAPDTSSVSKRRDAPQA